MGIYCPDGSNCCGQLRNYNRVSASRDEYLHEPVRAYKYIYGGLSEPARFPKFWDNYYRFWKTYEGQTSFVIIHRYTSCRSHEAYYTEKLTVFFFLNPQARLELFLTIEYSSPSRPSQPSLLCMCRLWLLFKSKYLCSADFHRQECSHWWPTKESVSTCNVHTAQIDEQWHCLFVQPVSVLDRSALSTLEVCCCTCTTKGYTIV